MNCCNCICPTNDPCRGPKGPMGPAGPSGSSRIADFFNLITDPIANGSAVPLFENVNLDPADISHTSGMADITLVTPGYYQISYDADAVRENEGLITMQISANGIAVAISVSTSFATANNPIHLSTSFILNNTTKNLVINLVNDSGAPVIFNNVNLTIQKINL